MGSGAGSNKVVVNPGTGGVTQRRARARPKDCTFPDAASESSALCTVRWLMPSAIARAELDHDSPSERKARTAPFSSSTGCASTTTSRARRGINVKPRFVARTSARGRSILRSLPISTRSRMRCDSSTNLAPNPRARSMSLGTSPGHASASARTSANNTGRVMSETIERASRTTCRHASTTSAFEANNDSTSCNNSVRSLPLAIRRAAGVFSTRDAFSTSAIKAGIPACLAARAARTRAARDALVCRRRIAMPATTSS